MPRHVYYEVHLSSSDAPPGMVWFKMRADLPSAAAMQIYEIAQKYQERSATPQHEQSESKQSDG